MLMSNGADLDENGPRDEPDSPPEIRLYGMIQPSGGGDYIPASDCVSSKPPYILHLEKLSAGIAWPSFLVDIRNCLWLAQQWHLVRVVEHLETRPVRCGSANWGPLSPGSFSAPDYGARPWCHRAPLGRSRQGGAQLCPVEPT